MDYKKLFEDFFDDIDDTQDITGGFNADGNDTNSSGEFLLSAKIRQISFWSGYSDDDVYDREKGVRTGYTNENKEYDIYQIMKVFKIIADNSILMSDADVVVRM